MDKSQLITEVIRPALSELSAYNANMKSPKAEELLANIVAHESKGGEYLRQLGGGPALSIFQVEPATHLDVWDNFVLPRPSLRKILLKMASNGFRLNSHEFDEELIFNLRYASAIARIVLWRSPEPLPAANDIIGMAHYWKNNYNSVHGKGTVERFISDAGAYV